MTMAVEPRRKRKAGLVTALSEPKTVVHQLAAEIQNYLYFPDPSALYVTLGAVAGNMIYGNPVWLVLVGPPGCGKTEILEMFVNMPSTRVVSVIKSPAVLLSGTGRKEVTAGATGGLLREIGLNGTLIMTDMAGMLKLASEPLGEVLAAFRDIYGGRWVRPIGTEGGRSLVWGPMRPGDSYGKLTFLGAATPAIDRHHTLNAELGERWVYFRFPDSDSHGETQAALRNKNPQAGREIIRQHIVNFFESLEFIKKRGSGPKSDELVMCGEKEKRDFTPYEEMRLKSMAMLSVRLRSEVPRDGYRHEIQDIAEPERPQRLATVLGQLYLGLEAIGLPELERWPLIGKVALDSTPRLRCEIVKAVWAMIKTGEADVMGMRDLAQMMKMYRSQPVVERAVEDLQIHGVCQVLNSRKAGKAVVTGDKEADGGGKTVGLTDWAEQMMRSGWGDN